MFSSALARTDEPEESRDASASSGGGGVRKKQPNPESRFGTGSVLMVFNVKNTCMPVAIFSCKEFC